MSAIERWAKLKDVGVSLIPRVFKARRKALKYIKDKCGQEPNLYAIPIGSYETGGSKFVGKYFYLSEFVADEDPEKIIEEITFSGYVRTGSRIWKDNWDGVPLEVAEEIVSYLEVYTKKNAWINYFDETYQKGA